MDDLTSYSYVNSDALNNNKHINKVKWTKAQDLFIKDMIETCGIKDWNAISNTFNKKFPTSLRSAKQCSLRWQKYIHPVLGSDPWSDKEEAELLSAHHKYKNSWSDISSALVGRSSNSVKTHFYTIFKRVISKIKKNDYSYTSNLELLQIHYILSIMQNCLPKVVDIKCITRGASTKITYKLLQSISPETITSYSNKFQELTVSCGSIQELFESILMESEPANIMIPEETSEISTDAEAIPQLDTELNIEPEENPMGREVTALDGLVLELTDALDAKKPSPYTLSTGSAETAATSVKAFSLETEPEDFGFSDFVERTYQATPNTASFSKTVIDMNEGEVIKVQ